MLKFPVFLIAPIVLVILLSACSAGNAPVVEYETGGRKAGYGTLSTAPRKQRTEGQHEVKQGETLYAIAWRYGWDHRTLAAANGISAPYTIHPGQVVQFDKPTDKGIAKSKEPAPQPKPEPKPEPKPSQPEKTEEPSKPAPKKPATKPKQGQPEVASHIGWQWPSDGKVKQGFSTTKSDQRGLLISGSYGAPVRAAGDGTVVYRGSGLTGYGNLLIVKHDSRWLSAYGHNDEMLVKEGEQVKKGDKIATMGASGTSTVQLHFEIRRDGQPVNPEQLLPRR